MKKMLKKISIVLCLLIFSSILLSACISNNNVGVDSGATEEELIISFLTNVYSSTEEDVEKLKESMENTKEQEDKDLFILYLQEKYEVSDEVMEDMTRNRYAGYYILKSYESGEFYKPEDIELTYVESMDIYAFELLLNGDCLEGSVRLEDGKVAWCELKFEPSK